MANRVKIIIENDSDWSLAATGEGNHFVLSSGALEAGSNLPPLLLEPRQSCNLTVSTPPGSPGPDGFVLYEFATLKLQVWIIWDDSNVKPGKATPNEEGEMVAAGIVNPFHLQWRQLDGAVGDFDPVPVTLTTETGKDLSFDKAFGVEGLVAKFTLRVKNATANADPPAVTTAVVPSGVVRPTGGSTAVIQPNFRTWDAPGLSQKRKKLLAAIGNKYPQIYVAPGAKISGTDPHATLAYQQMVCWAPGSGTSCTSVNVMVEGLLTKGAGKWAFAAYEMKDAWVPWAANPLKPMPSVGDIYILYRDIVADVRTKVTDEPHERHCGFILYVPQGPDESWITADGGQTITVSGDAAFLNRRPWEKRLPEQTDPAKKKIWDKAMAAHTFAAPIQATEYPYLGGGAESKDDLSDANRLIGWIDLDSPAISFKREAFDKPVNGPKKIQRMGGITEYDYQFLGAWIDQLTGKRPDALAAWKAHLKDPENNPPPWQPEAEPAA